MASLGLGTSLFALRRQLLATPCRTATPRLFDATRSRLLSSTAFRPNAAAKSAPRTIKPSASVLRAKPQPPARGTPAPTRYAFIKSLGAKTTPTILYESSSHFWFYFGCWSSGITILAWTALTGPTVVHQPEGTPSWVGYVFGAAYVLLGSMAFYILSKTPNVVRSIRLLPAVPSPAPVVVAPRAAAAAAQPLTAALPATAAATAMPQLEVTVNRMVPMLSPKILVTSLDNVALKSRFSLPDEYVPELKRLEQQRAAEETRAKQRTFDLQHLLTIPFRHIARAVSGFFRGVRAAWTDMGFATIKVGGKEFKVDVTRGFAHEGFKTLERLVSVGYKSG
ncbi:hypothetical protein CCM_01807 [Cordyceps militaris CM01]|uniref:Uncharacterized protein n=1 Tax=Cordyceps militaris (strain CM01) TaxID=983644 RepID=G3J7I2_CORMM|nr:uncharacterized protein CCM_01807 [Cordyceps militaris CM01]EGX97148.1 hypothetical protein CCM_01807 [Cordyceps militaris CM01]